MTHRSHPARNRRRHLLALGAALAALLGVAGCKGNKDAKEDQGAKDKASLGKYAEAAEARFAKDGGKFLKTDVLVYCRSGNLIPGSKLEPLGFTPPKGPPSRSYCYNVSDNLKKVALSVGDGSGENVLCQVLDGTSGKVVRGKPTRTSRCLP